MFNLKQFKLVKQLKETNLQNAWVRFSALSKNQTRNDFMSSVISDNKFVQEDLKLRAMVEEMIKKEFPERLQNKESYEFLVDSVVSKLKQKLLGNLSVEDSLN